jgi:thiol-disulfide isomerase/thioredoxin
LVEIKAMHVVHATWCPHCYPTTVEPLQKVSEELGIPLFLYDIDVPEQEKRADEFVRGFGDWSEDYIIPQVFMEMSDGEIRHVLTGCSEGVDLTKRAVSNLLNGPLFAKAGRHVKR